MRVSMGLAMVLAACGDDGAAARLDAAVDACVAQTPTIVFLNRAGGTYTGGPDDAAANVSTVLDMSRTLAPWAYDEANWTAVKQCVTDALAPFSMTVTDVDPGAVDHHEIVFTTQYWGNSNVGSIGPFLCSNHLQRSITFVFGSQTAGDVTVSCEYAVSQLASATANLDHAFDCHDFMGVNRQACGAKMWLDQDVPCGDGVARTCQCSGAATQNSYRTMVATFGASCH